MNIWGKIVQLGRNLLNPVRRTAQTYVNQYALLFGNTKKPTMHKLNRENLRLFAKNAIVRRAIEIIKDNVLKLPYQIKSKDGLDHSGEIRIIQNILSKPNNVDSYITFFKQIIEDILVLDAGAFEKARSDNKNHPLFLFPIDGATLECVMSWQGDPNEPRYAQYIEGERKYFLDSQVAYIRKVIFTDNPFGLSPLETAFKYVNYLVNTQEYANDIASNAIPKFLATVGSSVQPDQLDKFRAYIANDIQGQSALALLNTDNLDSKQVAPIGDEALYLQWQKLLIQIIAVSFGIPSEFLGNDISNDRSTIDEKNENLLENTIKPYAIVLQEAIQHHIIEQLGYGDILQFEYIYSPTNTQQKQISDIIRNLVLSDVLTLNEARNALNGYLPIKLDNINDEYGDMRLTQYKTELNIKMSKETLGNTGGFNGSGNQKDNYSNKVTDNKLKE